MLEFESKLRLNIFNLHYELKSKKYKHSNYYSFYLKDPKLRHINKACVKDRVLHHAIFRILYHVFERIFIFDSYSCRILKGTHRAVIRLNHFARKVNQNNTKQCFILKLDVKKFFDSIDHDILIRLLRKKIIDENLMWLLIEIINSFCVVENKGIPLGNVVSQLFTNIYLNKLDKFIKYRLKIKYYIRYCDDFVILSGNKLYLEGLIFKINDFLKNNLKLSLHPNKIIIKKYHQGIDFLGYVSFPKHIILRNRTKNRIFRKINLKMAEFKKNKISEKSFNQTLQSYFGVLKHCNGYKIKEGIISLIFDRNKIE